MNEIVIPASVEQPEPISATRRYRSKGFSFMSQFRGLLLPIALLAIWELGVKMGWLEAHLLPPPSELFDGLIELNQSGELFSHIEISFYRVVGGFGIGALLAVGIGAWVGLSQTARDLMDPTFQALRAIPSLAWVPLLLVWLGVDEAPKITLIAIGTFFPVYLNFVTGIQQVDRKLVEVGQMYGLNKRQLITRIFLPASLPTLFTGLRTGFSLAWMFLVAAELIAASQGIGYLLTDGRETGRVDIVLISILILALLGKLTDEFIKQFEHRFLAWQDTFNQLNK